ncbi:MAG: ATP-dependent 6-phosphofructokinase [Thermoplasmata archaeon]|nr:MAG: ATP-dependent 6-phosphofructokinase [Thermoplasmata archaeon]
MRIGVLTGGGDCPGLNHAIRGLVLRAGQLGHEVVGFRDGWKGVLEGDTIPLGRAEVDAVHDVGGTMLGTSRTNVFKIEDGPNKVAESLERLGIDCLVGIGGEDTLGVLHKLSELGVPAVGCPKTIDNDLDATEFTIGFDTSINISTQAIDRLHTTARSHHRCLVVEIMGRHAGWMAWYAGIAGGAHAILLPEEPVDLDRLVKVVKERAGPDGRGYSIIAASEGAKLDEGEEILQDQSLDAFGHVKLGGIGKRLAKLIEERTGVESRSVVLGHIQRGGPPSALDRVLSTQFGWYAAELVDSGEYGKMPASRSGRIEIVTLADAVGRLKTVDDERIRVSNGLWWA